MFQRCYFASGNGYASPTTWVRDSSGRFQQMPLAMGTRMAVPISAVINSPQACLVSPAEIAAGGGAAASTITPLENQSGELSLARREYQEGVVGAPTTIRISFANTSGTTYFPIIGDGNTVIFGSGRYSALPSSGFMIGGTFGTNSLAQMRTFSANSAIRITDLQLNYSATSFLSNGSVVSAYGEIDGSVTTKDLGLATWQKPTDFQDLIVVVPQSPDPFRLILDPQTAIIIGVPTGITVTATFTAASVAKGRDMKRI